MIWHESDGYEIGIDVDDVLVQCHERVCALASSVVGYYVDPATTPHKLELAVGREAAAAVWATIDLRPGWNSQAPNLEALEALGRLRLLGTVVAVTSPHTTGTWMNDRAAWLRSVGFAKDDIIQTSGKFRIPVHALIDDLLPNLVAWKRRNPGGLAILWTSAHNTHVAYPSSVMRVSNWADAIAAIAAHKQARQDQYGT